MADKAESLRMEGRTLFQSERWTKAASVSTQYIGFLLKEGGASEQLVVGYSNRAETFLRLKESYLRLTARSQKKRKTDVVLHRVYTGSTEPSIPVRIWADVADVADDAPVFVTKSFEQCS
ncbi:hypothetical protein R1sor_024637 [Riccia sorocarpa]|uniref:Uncharacterized protein n=1 Tax=Riccia sorocarpa TaxID=122646 RepID=A0ABD3GSM7_9MARC